MKKKLGALALGLLSLIFGTSLVLASGISGGGEGVPGGSDTQIQYNNGGVFGGAAEFNYNDSTNEVYGTTFNNQLTKNMVGSHLGILTDCRLSVAWVTPYTTESDFSGRTHNGTYTGWAGTERVQKGFSWSLQGAASKYVDFGDHADFSFGDGANDSPFTVGFWVEIITPPAGFQYFITKLTSTTGSEQREWYTALNNTRILYIGMYDEDTNVQAFRASDAAVSTGWHRIVFTYDGGGGATAANGLTIYVDGLLVASTATNNAAYVSMVNTTAPVLTSCYRGNTGVLQDFYTGKFGHMFIEASQLNAAAVWRDYMTTRGYYNR